MNDPVMSRLVLMALISLLTFSCHTTIKAQTMTSAEITEFSAKYMDTMAARKIPRNEIGLQLMSKIMWLEQIEEVCGDYYYVDRQKMAHRHQLYSATWQRYFSSHVDGSSIVTEVKRRRYSERNKANSDQQWCESIRQFAIQSLGWEEFFLKSATTQ